MRKLIVAAALLLASPAAAQQGVPYFPQTIPSGTFIGRLSSGTGPTEAISTTAMLNALFPQNAAAFPFNAASVAYQGSVSGAVTVAGQAATNTYSFFWPSTVGASNNCLIETVSGTVATGSWQSCARLAANNTFTGNNTHNGTETFAGLSNFTSTFEISGTAENFPPSGNLVGTSDTQTLTNKSIDAGQITGTISYARLPSGINANNTVTKTANYTIATSDCGNTISGSGGPFTFTLPAVTGFAATCVVQICNANANDATHHAIRLSGFPAPSLGRLWMQQCEEVSINSGAWIATKLPGKFRPGFVPTLYVDTTNGSDTNDGLISNASGNALSTVQNCWTIFQREMDLGTAQPTCSPTGGQTFTGGLACSAAMVPTVYFLVGNGGRAVIRNTGGNVVVQENDFCGYIIFDNVNLDCTSAASHPCIGLFIHQQNGADLSTSGFTNGVTFTGANASDVGVSCDSMCKINSGAAVTLTGSGLAQGFSMNLGSMLNIQFGVAVGTGLTISNNVFQILSGSQLVYSGAMTAGSPVSVAQIFGVQGNGSQVCIGSLSVTGTFTGARQWAVLNQGTLVNTSATAVPGTAGITTSAGFLNGAVVATSASGC